MVLSAKAQQIQKEIAGDAKPGALRSIAKNIGTDHKTAMELWKTGGFSEQLLALLIMDRKQFTQDIVDGFFMDMEKHCAPDRMQLADWLLANQLSKDKKNTDMVNSWQDSPMPLQRRIFWYHQARLRWTGQTPPDNTKTLLSVIEAKLLGEKPEVQWAMNFTAAWIGIFDRTYRSQCMAMGEKLGLYKDEVVARNCHPEYLPKFIETEVAKRNIS